jgi:hypothetical protein
MSNKGFIQLTHKGSSRPIYVEASAVIAVEPDRENGCNVRAGKDINFNVEESHSVVINLVNAMRNDNYKQIEGDANGNKKNFQNQ